MTLRQKRILAILALANAIVVAGLIFSLADSGRLGAPPSFSPPMGGGWGGWEQPHQACEWEATQRLAQAGLGGTVTLIPNGPLRFEIMYPPDPQDTDRGAGLAAQSVWTAFDIATEVYAGEYTRFEYTRLSTPVSGTLQQEECPAFTRVEVTIFVHSTQIHASVRTPDLVALSAGELSEAEFIERVTYHSQR
jgi:hypothetical protein